MATALWVVYDIIIFIVGFKFLDRKLTCKEKLAITGLALVGLVIAVFNYHADREQYDLLTSLKKGQEFTKGQFDAISHFLGGQSVSSTAELKDKLQSLQGMVSDLQRYKSAHEVQEWPPLNAQQQQEWAAALSKYSGQLRAIQLIDVDSRGELLVDSLLKVFRAAHLPEPTIGTDGIGLTNGLRIAAQPKEVGDTAKHLFEKLGYKVPAVAEIRASQPMLQIMIGRRD